MWFIFAVPLMASSPATECGKFSNADCDYCLSQIGNYTCGYCLDTKGCIPGDDSGPFSGSCSDWIRDLTDDRCAEDSYLGFSLVVRIVIGIMAALISVATLIFWIILFPRIFVHDTLSMAGTDHNM